MTKFILTGHLGLVETSRLTEGLSKDSPQLPPLLQPSLNHFGHLPPLRTFKSFSRARLVSSITTATYPSCYSITDAQRGETMWPGQQTHVIPLG